VGFVVGALVYFPLRKIEARRTTSAFEPVAADKSSTEATVPETA
jgi:hypothetical protein